MSAKNIFALPALGLVKCLQKAFFSAIIAFIGLFYASPLMSQTDFEQQLGHARQLNQQNRAADAYAIAHAIAQKLKNNPQNPFLSDALTVEGNALVRLKKRRAAISILTNALELRQKMYGKDRIEYANACQNLAHAYLETENTETALRLLKETQRVREVVLPPSHPDLAKLYASLAGVWNKMRFFDSTISLRARCPSEAPPQYLVPFYVQISRAFSEKMDWPAAFTYLDRAQSLAADMPEQLAMCLQNGGLFYIAQGKPAEAEMYFQKASSVLKINGLEDTEINADLYLNWATCARRLGKPAVAMANLTQAFSRYEASDNKGKMADIALNLGILATENKDFSAAHHYFQKAETAAQQAEYKDKTFLANLFLQKATAFGVQKKDIDARLTLQKAQNIKVSDPNLALEIHVLAAELAAAAHKFQAAQAALQRAQAVVAAAGSSIEPMLYLRLLATEALVFKQELDAPHTPLSIKSLKVSLAHYEAAIRFLESIVTTSNAQASAWFWQKQYGFLFDDAIALSYDIGQQSLAAESLYWQEKLLTYVEKSKNVWLHHLRQMHNARGLMPDSLCRKQAQLLLVINELEKNEQLFRQKGVSAKKQLSDVEAQLFEVKKEQERLLETMKKWTDLADKSRPKAAPSIARLQQGLTSDQAVLHYHVADSVIWILVLTKENIGIKKVKKTADWSKKLTDYYNLLRNGRVAEAQKSLETEAESLDKLATLSYFFYQKLVEPAALFLNRKTTLTIIPDGELSYLPFEAFHTEGGQKGRNVWDFPYLLRRFSVHYAYDWASLTTQQTTATFFNAKSPLVIAPDFQGNINGLRSLKFNNEEGRRIHDKIGGVFLEKSAATEGGFLSHLNQSSIIHLATHGIVNIDNPSLSGVAFTDVVDSLENELLFVQEIYGLSLETDLIVLSACETNIGQILSGEGVLSIARAFTYAGAKSLVTSLWSIDDQTTAGLMVRFYDNLERGMTKSAALRQAKLDFISSNRAQAHPFYWAALTALGDDTPLVFSHKKTWWTPLSILAILGLLGGFFWQKRRFLKEKKLQMHLRNTE